MGLKACPGIDHPAAYPVEVVLTQEGDQVRVNVVGEMYRMRMFFEDEGKMKFPRNMGQKHGNARIHRGRNQGCDPGCPLLVFARGYYSYER